MRGGRHAYVDGADGLHASADDRAEDDRATVDRAVGLLAGRTRCRLSDAHRHMLRIARAQNRDVVDVAAGVIGLLDVPAGPAGPVPPLPAGPVARHTEPWAATVQQVLDAVPGAAALLAPIRDDTGRLCDLVFAAVSPDAVAPDGRRGPHLLGTTLSGYFPHSLVSDRWDTYARVLATGEPAAVPPFRLDEGVFSVRAFRLGESLLLTWTRHDQAAPESDRLASTER
ncbi:MAG TPA: ANTAR domain-containing protein, partial [Actinoplanes sp.]|nr:ANTAR domain-containing protein [Actinoplanes sp.]